MNQESTEAVLELCLQTQHENTKNAIKKFIEQIVLLRQRENHPRTGTDVLTEGIIEWINELKLEDTE